MSIPNQGPKSDSWWIGTHACPHCPCLHTVMLLPADATTREFEYECPVSKATTTFPLSEFVHSAEPQPAHAKDRTARGMVTAKRKEPGTAR